MYNVEKLDASFPLVAQLRKTLEEACVRKEIDVPNDRLSIVIVGVTGITQLPTGMRSKMHMVLMATADHELYCKIRVGFFEEEKETNAAPLVSGAEEYSVTWREFYEFTLTKAAERYYRQCKLFY